MRNQGSPTRTGKKIQNRGRLYTQRDLSLIFSDVPNKTLIFWAREGLVEWVAERKDARGIARLYNRWNLFQMALVREMAGLGISISHIRLIMGTFKDFPIERPPRYDEKEKIIVDEPLQSEKFLSKEGLKYKLVVIKKLGARGWQEPLISGTSKLTDDDPFKIAFGSFMESHTTIIINLSAVQDFVDSLIEEAGLS